MNTGTPSSSPARVRTYAGHGLRLAAWAAVAWCVHVAHARQQARLAAVDLAAVPVEVVRRHLPEATAIGGKSPAVAGGRDVVGVIVAGHGGASCGGL